MRSTWEIIDDKVGDYYKACERARAQGQERPIASLWVDRNVTDFYRDDVLRRIERCTRDAGIVGRSILEMPPSSLTRGRW